MTSCPILPCPPTLPPGPHPNVLACGRGDCQVEEDLVRLRWPHRWPLHRSPTGQAPHAPPVPQLKLQKFGCAERPDPTWHFARRSVARTRPSLPPVAGGWGRGGKGVARRQAPDRATQTHRVSPPLPATRRRGPPSPTSPSATRPCRGRSRAGPGATCSITSAQRRRGPPSRPLWRRRRSRAPKPNARGDSGPEPFWQRLDSPS